MNPYLFIVGTRPEAVKLLPVFSALAKRERGLCKLYFSGQHADLATPVFFDFGILPDLADTVPPAGGLFPLFSALALGVSRALSGDFRGVVVQGDTLTALAGATAGFLSGIPVYHVEAGLRTYRPCAPFPEEMARRAIAPMAHRHFCTTEAARQNLLREGVDDGAVTVSGNTALDAMARFSGFPLTVRMPPARGKILATLHRREATDTEIAEVFSALGRLGRAGYSVLFLLHKNPRVRRLAFSVLGENAVGVTLSEALPPSAFYPLLRSVDLVLTDSGGVSEESAALGKRTLVVRRETERVWEWQAGRITLVSPTATAVCEAVAAAMATPERPPILPKISPSEIIAERLYSDAFG